MQSTMDRSRVLFIGHTASLGGAELALYRLVTNLDRVRFEPVVLLFAEGPLATMFRELQVEVRCLPLASEINQASRNAMRWSALFRIREILLVLQQVYRVARFIRKSRIDLVHTNSLKAAIIGGLAATFARKPLVWYVHDRIASDYLPALAVKGLHLLALTLPTFVVGNSLSTLRTFLPTLPRLCNVVYPGVDIELFRPAGETDIAPPFSTHREISVGIVGRISPTKGQDIFIRAAALVAKRHPEVKFLIIGSAMFNDASWEKEIRRLASEETGAQIEFTGFCADIPRRMAALDLVVHASTVPEPFGQVVAEAMSCGKPVVAIAAGGVPELVTNGHCGWLVAQGDAEQMSERIIWIIQHPVEACAMGKRGRHRVASYFTVQKMAQDMAGIYDQSLAAGVPRLWTRLWQAHSILTLMFEPIASKADTAG